MHKIFASGSERDDLLTTISRISLTLRQPAVNQLLDNTTYARIVLAKNPGN